MAIQTISPIPISAIIRLVGDLKETTERLITLLSSVGIEVIITYSGTDVDYFELVKKYQPIKTIKILRVYSFGILEPVIPFALDSAVNPWIMIFTDTEYISEELVNSLGSILKSDADAYYIQKRTIFINEKIPNWIRELYTDSFRLMVFKKEAVEINEIIHQPYRVYRKGSYLDPSKFYISHIFDYDYTAEAVKEKIKRYIMIEMFETRKSISYVLRKLLEKVKTRYATNRDVIGYKGLSQRELSYFEYKIYDLVSNLLSGKIGLTDYQKIRNKSLRNLRKDKYAKEVTFQISQKVQSTGSVLKFLGLSYSDVEVRNGASPLVGMESPSGSEEKFVTLLVKRYFKLNGESIENIQKVDAIVAAVKDAIEEALAGY